MPTPTQRFLIAPYKSGLQLNVKPWLIMQDAFEILRNVHVWRGRVKKRFGAKVMNESLSAIQQQLFTRLRINIGTTEVVSGNFVLNPVPGDEWALGSQFSIGDTIYTVDVANGALLTTSAVATGIFDTITGALDITGNTENPLTTVYYYPLDPVMNFALYESNAINDSLCIAFDIQFSYQFIKANGWQRFGTATWTGDDSNFFSVCNYRGPDEFDYYLYAVNGVQADQIKYYDSNDWNSFSPQYSTTGDTNGFVIQTALFVVPFQNRLLLLGPTLQTGSGPNTYEYFGSRIIWSAQGDPTANDGHGNYSSWLPGPPGYSSYLDIYTKEVITGYQYLKDRLMIFCESSTWELVFTGGNIDPFRVQKINTELGVESADSIVPFDKAVLGFGSNGILACNGINVERIDSDIPNVIFDIINSNNGPLRVSGIRDYFTKEVYWSYPSSAQSGAFADIFPNRVLIYNYDNNTWAYNDDSITAFGYYYLEADITWDDLDQEWQESSEVWDDPALTSLFRTVVAGNQQGFTFLVDADKNNNSMSLSIADITITGINIELTVYNHNIVDTSVFLYIDNLQGSGTIPNLNGNIYQVYSITDEDTITIQASGINGAYTGAGTCQLVSQIEFFSKQYNFFTTAGRKFSVPRLDFLITPSEAGNVTWNYYATFNSQPLSGQGQLSGALYSNTNMQTFPITTTENSQEMIWRSKWPIFDGETFQYSITLSPTQMMNQDDAFAGFELNAVLFFVRPTGDFKEF
jgi:hypothetical protein